MQSAEGKVGYLSAFSGKLADSNHHEGFVPPIYDMLVDGSHFKQEEIIINDYTIQIDKLEENEHYRNLKSSLEEAKRKAKETIAQTKVNIKTAKVERRKQRETMKPKLDQDAYDTLLEQLKKQSIQSSYYLKDEIKYWDERTKKAQHDLQAMKEPILSLKNERKAKSNALQQHLFRQYKFLNALGGEQDLLDIFSERLGIPPPAGSGECAAPKLLHYAYKHQLKPIAMAEFWWGQSPKSQVRKHQQFYPACRSKCEPILGHMLQGLNVDPNPIQDTTQKAGDITILNEDDHIVVINKPPELLSVPGKIITDSIWSRMRHRYPDATCLLYTSPSPRDRTRSRMPSSA